MSKCKLHIWSFWWIKCLQIYESNWLFNVEMGGIADSVFQYSIGVEKLWVISFPFHHCLKRVIWSIEYICLSVFLSYVIVHIYYLGSRGSRDTWVAIVSLCRILGHSCSRVGQARGFFHDPNFKFCFHKL